MALSGYRHVNEENSFLLTPQGETAIRIAELPVSFGEADNLVQTLDSSVIIDNDAGFNTVGFYCSPPASGIITFETTYDGVHWEPTSIRGVTDDKVMSQIDTAGNFIGSIAANRSFRFRTSTEGTSTGTVAGRLHRNTSVIETVEFGYPPHKVGFDTVRHHDAFTETQTDTVLWTPPSGKRVVLTDLFVFAHGSTDGRITVFMEDNTNGNVIFNTEVAVALIAPFTWSHQYKLGIVGGVDESVKLTTDAAVDCDIMCHGYET